MIDAFPGCQICEVHPLAFLPFLSYANCACPPDRFACSGEWRRLGTGFTTPARSEPFPFRLASRLRSLSSCCVLFPAPVYPYSRCEAASLLPPVRLLPEFSHFVRMGQDNGGRARKMVPGYLASSSGFREGREWVKGGGKVARSQVPLT